MLKKAGIVTAGVTAALLAAAPLASAGEYNGDYDKDRDRDSSKDRDHDKDRDVEFGDVDGDFNNQCYTEAGDVENDQDVDAQSGAASIPVTLGAVASGSNVNVLNCTNILNDILNDNDVAISVLGDSVSGLNN